MQERKLSFSLNITTLIAIITMFVSAIWYIYSIDKRLSLVEQDVVHVEQGMEQQDRQLDRLENKLDKIYAILAEKSSLRKIEE